MCTGLEALIPALISGGLSAAGGAITANEQQKNAERQAQARNDELKRTLVKNDALANQSRDTFDARQKLVQPAEADKSKLQAEQARTADANKAVDTALKDSIPLSGSAPQVIQSDLAKKMGEVLAGSKKQAAAQSKLSGYGDMWLDQGFADQNAGRNLSVDSNFANGNMALLPYQQDFAETRAYKPISPLGGLLQGFGGAIGSMGGGGGLTPKKSYTSPMSSTGHWFH